jgi:hypothetical protein
VPCMSPMKTPGAVSTCSIPSMLLQARFLLSGWDEQDISASAHSARSLNRVVPPTCPLWSFFSAGCGGDHVLFKSQPAEHCIQIRRGRARDTKGNVLWVPGETEPG